MGSPLLTRPDRGVTLPLLCLPGPRYFAAIASHGHPVVDMAPRYDKRRKATHRYEIADARGRLRLTIPVSLPAAAAPGRLTWGDVTVSAQAGWWRTHLTALESAYGRTPYFEYYIHRFLPVYSRDYAAVTVPLAALDLELTGICCDCLGIHRPAPAPPGAPAPAPLPEGPLPPYHQLRQQEQGFHNGLSVLDLIFNLGPEAQVYLKHLIDTDPPLRAYDY